jgi:dTMP kinase
MRKGKLIALEGCEGSGKTSVLNALKGAYEGSPQFVFTREPGGTAISEEIRGILMAGSSKGMTPLTELLLFCSARAQHCEEIITPALKNGRVVICDRFEASTVAYQLWGRNRFNLLEAFEKINTFAKQGISKPDITIFLDVDPEVGLQRKKGQGENTRFDSEKLEFHNKVRQGFMAQYLGSPTWECIDTTSISEDEVCEKALAIVAKFLSTNGTNGRR